MRVAEGTVEVSRFRIIVLQSFPIEIVHSAVQEILIKSFRSVGAEWHCQNQAKHEGYKDAI